MKLIQHIRPDSPRQLTVCAPLVKVTYSLMLRTERDRCEVDKFLISGLERRQVDL